MQGPKNIMQFIYAHLIGIVEADHVVASRVSCINFWHYGTLN